MPFCRPKCMLTSPNTTRKRAVVFSRFSDFSVFVRNFQISRTCFFPGYRIDYHVLLRSVLHSGLPPLYTHCYCSDCWICYFDSSEVVEKGGRRLGYASAFIGTHLFFRFYNGRCSIPDTYSTRLSITFLVNLYRKPVL